MNLAARLRILWALKHLIAIGRRPAQRYPVVIATKCYSLVFLTSKKAISASCGIANSWTIADTRARQRAEDEGPRQGASGTI